VCLLFAGAGSGVFLAGISGSLSDRSARGLTVRLTALFAISFVTVPLGALGGRRWHRRDPRAQVVLRDEWAQKGWNWACRVGIGAAVWTQVLLAFLTDHFVSQAPLFVMAGLPMTRGGASSPATSTSGGSRTMTDQAVTNTVRVQRAKRDLTQADLAALAGITRASVNAIGGSRMLPSLLLALNLARALRVSVDELFDLTWEDQVAAEPASPTPVRAVSPAAQANGASPQC